MKKRPKLCKLTVNKPFSVNKKGGREMRHHLQKKWQHLRRCHLIIYSIFNNQSLKNQQSIIKH